MAVGFNLYRGESMTGPWSLLNSDLIPITAPPGTPDADYSFTDSMILPRVQYFYRVEAIDPYLAPHDYGILSYEGYPVFVPLVNKADK